MSPTHYAFLIDFVCMIGFLFLTLPVALYLATGWVVRREKLFSYLTIDALTVYYGQFPWTKSNDADLRIRFKNQFDYLYGRRHYIAPVLLFTVIAGGAFLAVARAVQLWFHVAPGIYTVPKVAVAATLGAFLWIASDEIGRIRRRDLAPIDIYGWVLRLLIAVPFGFSVAAVLKEDAGIPVAFFLGAFPTDTLFTFARRIASQKLGMGDQIPDGTLELQSLQSIDRNNAERYQDEGIRSISALAWADPVDLTIRTNFDFNYVLDCMSQALLWVYFEDKTKLLFPLSLRGAQEVSSLINDLPDVDLPVPAGTTLTPEESKAVTTVGAAAALLNIQPGALCTTLHQVDSDPYTDFIRKVWH